MRIKGDTYRAIECFRSALKEQPKNADVLLNLARVLLNLGFMDDAIYLAKKAIDTQPPEQNTWLQHFMLGEILQISGQLEQAALHFQSSIDQNPNFHPALAHLKQLGQLEHEHSSNLYTVLVITLLCSSIVPYLYFAVIKEESSETANNITIHTRKGLFRRGMSRHRYR